MNRNDNIVLLRAARLVDGAGNPPIKDAAIRIEGNRIAEIGASSTVSGPPNSKRIELGECTLLPGMIDAHMHFFGVASDELHMLPFEREAYRVLRAAGEARKMLEAGITAARCLGSSVSPDLRRAINEGHVPGPRILAAGEFICSTNGTWDHISIPIDYTKKLDMIADGVDEMRAIVRRRARSGSDLIKIGLSKGHVHAQNHPWGDGPAAQDIAYSVAEAKAAVEEAHANNLKVSAHCVGDAAVRAALDSGIDVIEHGHGISEDTRRRLRDENALVVSTICQAMYHVMAGERFHYPQAERDLWDRHFERMRFDFQKNLELGIRYALGTDMIGRPTHPLDAAAREFEMAVKWGMSEMQAIVAGTSVSAEALGLEKEIGSLQKGKLADIIAVPGNPLDEIAVMQKPVFVMLNGEVAVDKSSGPNIARPSNIILSNDPIRPTLRNR